MKLFVYKGFDLGFLSQLTAIPLTDSEIIDKKNVLQFDVKVRRLLDRALLSMDDDDDRWVTYEEYSLIKDRVELAAKDYGLEVIIYINNLFPEYYPIEFPMGVDLVDEIQRNLGHEITSEPTKECRNFLAVYDALEIIDGEIYVSFYNYELEKNLTVTTKQFYPAADPVNYLETYDLHIHITNDIALYLKELVKIRKNSPRSISFSMTKGAISDRNIVSLCAYCQHNGIAVSRNADPLAALHFKESELMDIAKNHIRIPNFESFRKLRFYKNPDISNEVVEISQAQIIGDILTQAERAISEDHDYRDIFITASTGAGKSVMFQIPAVYLAKKHRKLTIVIEPVKALMQDQKEQLNARGYFKAETFNSDLISQAEKEAVLEKVKNGETDLLYLSPETLLSYSIETLIGDREIGLIIIDEAHIVTTWGVGFRPDYWYLGGYISRLRSQIQTQHNKNKKVMHFPICAFTATAVNGGLDDSVSETIISLYMENPIKYIGYVKRDDIKFDIHIKSLDKLHNPDYEDRKAGDLACRMNDWISSQTKTIVYFPYASYAGDAYKGIKSFSGKDFDRDKVAVYTGRNLNDQSAAALADSKRRAFEAFRSGVKPVMLATKAFGMGVDVNDIVNVYHYAVTGNLSDYVQEIGRAARKSGLTGHAVTDYYYNDISFMQKLFGMSQIKQYQINLVLSGIYNTYKNKKENRSFLISPESFTYIFTGKDTANNSDNQIGKLKTCLLMLEKDLYDKFNFKVLISRPQGIFTKAYVVIQEEYKETVLRSEYGKYFSYIAPGRKKDEQTDSIFISDIGDIYSLDLKSVWENHYPNLSFPQFKYWYFNKNQKGKDKIAIMPEICEMFYVRQRVTVETKDDLLLCDLRDRLLEDFAYIADTLYSDFKRSYFTLEDFAKAISPRFGITKARIIVNSIFHLADPEGKCVKYRSYSDHTVSAYTLSNGTFKEMLNRTVTRSPFIRNLKGNTNTSISKFMPPLSDGNDSVALKMLSIFDYATYEVMGGEEPEIFIRLNDPEKIRRIVFGEIKYSNSYVTKAKQKHEREVKILRRFFTETLDNAQRWDYIERYFLGDDVLCEAETVVEEKVELRRFIEKEQSYQTSGFRSWKEMLSFFDKNVQSIITALDEQNVPLPDYLTTVIKHALLSGDIVMSWEDRGVIVFAESISEETAAICEKKGWTAFELLSLDAARLKEALR
ncbi:DEAD/DEAH box helicase [Bacilliculturomica massiliensis]|uniref:DEAD/DEAH box helicase n=1 Tax=Bacilliculturomica massiliensis TaxID=1917867 RepID=UPI001030361F|nr:DEAD/DEAH box helicase [Bacilliculturomica massiliensis]